jgi:hypothetical protein
MLRKEWILTPVLALGLGHAAFGQTVDASSDARHQSQIEASSQTDIGVQTMFDGNVAAELEADLGASLVAEIDNELIASLEADLNNELETAIQADIEREVQSAVEAELESTVNGALGGL